MCSWQAKRVSCSLDSGIFNFEWVTQELSNPSEGPGARAAYTLHLQACCFLGTKGDPSSG